MFSNYFLKIFDYIFFKFTFSFHFYLMVRPEKFNNKLEFNAFSKLMKLHFFFKGKKKLGKKDYCELIR